MYRPEIDGLRAIAVLSVIISHFNKDILPGGHLGVDIFFVISGFVITQSLVSRQHRSFRSFLLDFYNRRVKRLVPALLLCVVVTCLLAMLFINPQSNLYNSSWKTGIAALFGFSNFYLLHQATDYFGSSAELNPFTHTWSLGVEEQFYLVFPFLIWFSGLSRKSEFGIRNFAWIICLMGVLSLVSYFWISNMNPVVAFYLMPTRFWELAIGSIVYLSLIKDDNRYQRLFQSASTLTAILLVGALFLPQEYASLTTFAVVILSAILILVLRNASLIYRLLTVKPIVLIGVISYSLYLWHWSVLTISHWTIGLHWWSIPFQLAVIFLLAIFSYRYVEQPLRRADWSYMRIGNSRLGAVGHALLAVLVCSVIIYSLAAPFKGQLYAGKPASILKKGVDTLLDNQDYHGRDYWLGRDCVLSSNDDVGRVIVPDNCSFGDVDTAERRFLVIGNSVSAAELEMFKILVDEKLGSVTITSSWGASAVPEVSIKNSWEKANKYYWTSVVPSLIEQLHRGDVVVIINDDKDFSPKTAGSSQKKRLNDLRKGLTRMSEELSKKGIYLIYQNGIPFMLEANCTPDTAMPQWWNLNNEPPCTYFTKEQTLARLRPYNNLLVELQREFKNFFVLDLFEIFCPSEICKYFNEEGVFLYRDEYSHPSVEANLLAQPALLETVKKVIESEPQ
jgi:peptidoglycan/LPS O-acetylase OafA/YrhL